MSAEPVEKCYFEIAHFQTKCLNDLRKQQEWLKAAIIALTLAIVGSVAGCALAIKEIKDRPVTVQIDDAMVELDRLPLPPLEEISLK